MNKRNRQLFGFWVGVLITAAMLLFHLREKTKPFDSDWISHFQLNSVVDQAIESFR